MNDDERSERIRRPVLARTGPVRSAAALFGGSTRPLDETPEGERLDDVMSRSVELGYRVIDTYVRQGREAARRLSGGDSPTYDLVSDARVLANRMVRAASELAAAWGDLFDLTDKRQSASATHESPSAPAPQATEAQTAPSAIVRIRLRVESPHAVEATLDVQHVPGSGALIAPVLRAETPGGAILRGAELRRDGDQALSLALAVRPDQPPGTYVGPLLDDATNSPVGWLTVTVGDERRRP